MQKRNPPRVRMEKRAGGQKRNVKTTLQNEDKCMNTNEIVIIQRYPTCSGCEVTLNGETKSAGFGRVMSKRHAMALHDETGFAIYNIKKGGRKVLVKPARTIPAKQS